MSHIYCPECGFQNPEAANYCAKCGALLHERESESVEQTQRSRPRSGRSCSRRSATSASRARRSSFARAAVGRARASRRSASALDRALAGLRRLPRRRRRSRAGTPSSTRGTAGLSRSAISAASTARSSTSAIESSAARGRRRGPDRQVPDDLPSADDDDRTEPGGACTRSAPSASVCGTSSPTSRSRRSATSRIRAAAAEPDALAATGCSPRPTSSV